MVSSNKLLQSILLAIAYTTATIASPMPAGAKHSTHGIREIGSGLKVEVFYPPSAYKVCIVVTNVTVLIVLTLTLTQTFSQGIGHNHRKRENATIDEAAVAFVVSQLNMKEDDIQIKATSESPIAKFAYVQQKLSGIPVANAVVNVAFNTEDKVIAFGSSFAKDST